MLNGQQLTCFFNYVRKFSLGRLSKRLWVDFSFSRRQILEMLGTEEILDWLTVGSQCEPISAFVFEKDTACLRRRESRG